MFQLILEDESIKCRQVKSNYENVTVFLLNWQQNESYYHGKDLQEIQLLLLRYAMEDQPLYLGLVRYT